MKNSTEVEALYFITCCCVHYVFGPAFPNPDPVSMRPIRSLHPDCVRIEVMHHSQFTG